MVQRVDDYNDTLYSLPTMKRDPAALLPLTPAMFQVLIALADGEKHGYAIMRDVESVTDTGQRMPNSACANR